MKSIFILSLLLAAAVADPISLLTFKSKSCENLAQDYHVKMFGDNNSFFLKNIGVMIVKMDVYQLMAKMHATSEFHECVKTIEKNEVITLDDPKIEVSSNEEREQWQLRRINVRQLPLPKDYHRYEVEDFSSHVYIIDSGIDENHPDFKGRLAPKEEHKTFTSDSCACKDDGALCDCGGHGTHCAGLVASPNAGYNPNTTLHSVKVFNWSGSTTWDVILSAIDWTIEAHRAHKGELGIASLSLGGGKIDAVNQGIDKMHESGLFVVVAAGNSNKDACTGSPSSATQAYTVGASEIDDSRAYFSEYGYIMT